MIHITKIFRFEMAHAISSYPGKCKDIHGHSYELHVTVASVSNPEDFIPGMGLVMDFKELKTIINECIILPLDHRLVLSKSFTDSNKVPEHQNLLTLDYEPSAENLLIYIQRSIQDNLPSHLKLTKLKLFETHDSFAEWIPSS